MRVHSANLLCLLAFAAATLLVAPACSKGATGGLGRPALAASVLTKLNAIRVSHKLVPLVVDKQLTTAALEHSKEMLARGYFSHDSYDGSSYAKRITRHYRKGKVGENLVWSAPDLGLRGRLFSGWGTQGTGTQFSIRAGA